VKRALKSDHSADDEGARHPADDDEIVVTHERIFQFAKSLPLATATIKLRDDCSARQSTADAYHAGRGHESMQQQRQVQPRVSKAPVA
jgi:hypothetical protein